MKYDSSKVTILILARNESQGIKKIIRSVKSYANEIIVIDGHSRDNTKDIVLREGVRFILDNGKGRGDGVRVGIEHAKNDILVFFDADGSHNASDIPKLVIPIIKKKADMVIGSRRTGGSFDLNMSFSGIMRSGGADMLAYFVNKRFNTRFSDIIYSFRAIKKASIERVQLTSDGFTIEQEMVVKCLKKGLTVLEVPSRENARAWGKSKLKTISGVGMFFSLLKDLYL